MTTLTPAAVRSRKNKKGMISPQCSGASHFAVGQHPLKQSHHFPLDVQGKRKKIVQTASYVAQDSVQHQHHIPSTLFHSAVPFARFLDYITNTPYLCFNAIMTGMQCKCYSAARCHVLRQKKVLYCYCCQVPAKFPPRPEGGDDFSSTLPKQPNPQGRHKVIMKLPHIF